MSDPLFQEAYARARSRFTEGGWLALSPREITEAIYGEIHRIDAERVAAQALGADGDAAATEGGSATSGAKTLKVEAVGRKSRGKVATPGSRNRPTSPVG